jgi:protein required for attachment to host cells
MYRRKRGTESAVAQSQTCLLSKDMDQEIKCSLLHMSVLCSLNQTVVEGLLQSMGVIVAEPRALGKQGSQSHRKL